MTQNGLKIGEVQDIINETKALLAFVRGFISSKSESHNKELEEEESFGCTQTIWHINDKLDNAYDKLDKILDKEMLN
jgi:hypothetical protein